jgi:hypothetical protein
MYEVIDTLDGDKVVESKPTFRRAFNAARRLEPNPTKPQGFRSFDGSRHTWRYLIRRA